MLTHLAALAALAAAVAFAAEPALKPVKVISVPSDSVVARSRYLLGPGSGSVGVWDLAGPRQIALVQVPDWEDHQTEAKGTSSVLLARDVSADGKWALVAFRRHTWVNADEYGTERWQLLLISVPEQRVVRAVADTGRHTCVPYGGILPSCPEVREAAFSPDGTRIWYRMDHDAWTDGPAQNLVLHHRMTDYLSDLSGRTLDKRAYEAVWTRRTDGYQWVFTPARALPGFLADGSPALVYADEAGCSVKTLAGKQISFLEDCTAASKPAFRGSRVVSEAGPFALWDPANGAAARRAVPLVPYLTAVSPDYSQVAEVSFDTAGAPAAALLRVADAAGRRTVLDRRLELPPGELDVSSEWSTGLSYDSQGGRVVIQVGSKDSKHFAVVYDLGGASASAEPAVAAAPKIDVDEPPVSKTKTDPNAYAVVIGVEKYRQDGIPAVDYAARDARTMYAYLTRAMGFDARNVVLLTDEKATKTDFEKNLGKWLQNRVDARSRVFVYYAGHGAPNAASGEGFLMPYEADPNYVEETAYPIGRLYAELAKLPTKDVTVVLDACFSGQGGRSLIAKGARPLVSVKETKGPSNAVVLAAATGGQISATDPERRHGLLTESLLEALHGAADARGDGKITAEEVYAYVRPAVERAARLQNIEQTPTLSPAPADLKGGRAWIELK